MDKFDFKQALPGLDEVDLDRIQAALMGLTQYHRRTKKEVVRQQWDAIEVVLSRGVGYAAVAAVLTEGGCAITARVLRKYLSQLRQERRKGAVATQQVDGLSPSSTNLGAFVGSGGGTNGSSVGAPGSGEVRRSLRRSALLSMNSSGNEK